MKGLADVVTCAKDFYSFDINNYDQVGDVRSVEPPFLLGADLSGGHPWESEVGAQSSVGKLGVWGNNRKIGIIEWVRWRIGG